MMAEKKILFLSFHYPPDQSAGATRSSLIINELINQKKKLKIWVLCSLPRRYGNKKFVKNKNPFIKNFSNNYLKIIRIWIPYFGQNSLSAALAYIFYFIQVIFISIFIRPDIVISTSAKLFTGFLGAIISKITKSLLYLDLRDTFVDNYFFLYRYKKRIILLGIFSLIERITFKTSYSINLISIGFRELLSNIENLTIHSKITNFTNGIDPEFKLKLNNIRRKKYKEGNNYKIIYAGNLGEGQSIYELIESLNKDNQTIYKMTKANITFEIYGSGAQLKKIKEYIFNSAKDPMNNLKFAVKYKGLVKKENIHLIYQEANCLMIQLSDLKSLEYVIPSKTFEYASTNLPILYGTKGFTSSFISKIQGTIPFNQKDSKSFFNAIIKSKKIVIDSEKRNLFLKNFITKNIYKRYAKHIISN